MFKHSTCDSLIEGSDDSVKQSKVSRLSWLAPRAKGARTGEVRSLKGQKTELRIDTPTRTNAAMLHSHTRVGIVAPSIGGSRLHKETRHLGSILGCGEMDVGFPSK